MDPIDFGPMLQKASELVNTLWPLFIAFYIWFGLGLLGWIIGVFFLDIFVYHDFLTGFHDGHEIILFGPIALVVVVSVIVQSIKDIKSKDVPADITQIYISLSHESQDKADVFLEKLLKEQERKQ
jgi:hypothetical protein